MTESLLTYKVISTKQMYINMSDYGKYVESRTWIKVLNKLGEMIFGGRPIWMILVYYVHTLLAVNIRIVAPVLSQVQFIAVKRYENAVKCKKKFKLHNLRIYLSSRSLILSSASFSFFFNSSLSFRFLRKERAYSYTVQLCFKPT